MTNVLIVPLRNYYGLGPASVGAPGDNNHLYGRHRSANWDRQSRYCTDRAYGTIDARDKRGNQNWYRAVDTGIQGKTLQDASHRMDALVRSGLAPGVAEWFGTFDGQTVVGWYEGHASSSDSSHLFHLHVGVWNESADDAALMQLLYGTITGTNVVTEDGVMAMLLKGNKNDVWLYDGCMTRRQVDPAQVADIGYWYTRDTGKPLKWATNDAGTVLTFDMAVVGPVFGADITNRPSGGGSGGITGPVDLTPAAVSQVADASANKTANEIAERLATP
jgi:hypothetical protein